MKNDNMQITRKNWNNTEVNVNGRTFNIVQERYAGMDKFSIYEKFELIDTSVTYDGALFYIKELTK